MPQTVGTLAAVWNVAYEAKDPHVSRLDVDTAAERDGFADLLIHPEVGLALALESDPRVFLHGVKKRIEYLITQAERGRRGGEAKANAKRTDGAFLANAKQTPSERLAEPYHSGGLPLPLPLPPDLPLPPPLDQDPDQSKRVSASPPLLPSKAKGKPTEAELATVRVVLDRLAERSGVNYRGSEKHTKLIVARLRQGVSEWDMRRVIGYCAEKLQWQGNPKMHHYLRPETMFGPETVEKYLDAARSWEPSPAPEDEAQAPPLLRLVTQDESRRNAATLTGPEWEEPSWMTTSKA